MKYELSEQESMILPCGWGVDLQMPDLPNMSSESRLSEQESVKLPCGWGVYLPRPGLPNISFESRL